MPVKVTEQLVTAEDGGTRGVRVRSDDFGRVVVTWFCGDTRTFAKDDLTAAVKAVKVVEKMPDVFVNLKDTNGSAFAGYVEDGVFYADNSAQRGGSGVPWADLQKALKKATQG